MSKYAQYKHIKLTLGNLTYKGYPLARVCASQLAMLVWKPNIYVILNYLNVSVAGLFDNLNGAAVNGLVITYSTQRADYLDLIARYFPKVEPVYVRPKSHWYPNWHAIPTNIKSLIKAIALIKMKFGWSFIEYIKAVIAIAVVIRLIDEVERSSIKCAQYVAFNSSYLAESVLAWHFRLRGVKTVSLQHGMYAKYVGKHPPMDVINYENICSDEIWLWGEYTYNQIKTLIPKDCKPIIKGYPVSKFGVSKKREAIYVLLPRDIYLEQSIELLSLLTDCNHAFIIRPHPSAIAGVREWMTSNLNANISSKFTLEEGGTIVKNMAENEYLYVISFNSTAIFEAILAGQKVIVFNRDAEFDCNGMPLFSNKKELDQLLTRAPKILKASYYYSHYIPDDIG